MSTLDNNLSRALHDIAYSDGRILALHEGRHPSSIHMLKVLAPNRNLSDPLRNISFEFFKLGLWSFENMTDGPELTAGLRKLLEAKDCLVRAALDQDPVDYRDR